MPIMLSSAFSLKSAKNMLIFPNYAKKCASTIEKSLLITIRRFYKAPPFFSRSLWMAKSLV